MSLSDADIAFAKDLFNDIPDLTTRKMFGGMCLYSDGKVFALMSSQAQIYLKTSDPQSLFGTKTDRFHNMPYWSVPDAILDDPTEVCTLARTALSLLE